MNYWPINWPATSRPNYTTRLLVTRASVAIWLAAAKLERLVFGEFWTSEHVWAYSNAAALFILEFAFLPRDAMLCLSVTSRCSIETDERIELAFGVWASFHQSCTVLKGNSIISKNKSTSVWNFVLNSGLKKFRHGISIVETCYQLSLRKVDAQSAINWTVVGQQVDNTSIRSPTLDHYSLSLIVKRCLQHDFVARVN